MPRLYSSRSMSLGAHDGALALESASASSPPVPGSEGPLLPGTGANDNAVGTVAWSNPSRITADDNIKTTADGESNVGATTNYLKGTNFGFAIPGGATVSGVVVEVDRQAFAGTADSTAKLVKGGTVSGDNKSTGATWTDETKTFGGASDLWGLTLTPADVNSSDFGFVLSAVLGEEFPAVDCIRITVHYTT